MVFSFATAKHRFSSNVCIRSKDSEGTQNTTFGEECGECVKTQVNRGNTVGHLSIDIGAARCINVLTTSSLLAQQLAHTLTCQVKMRCDPTLFEEGARPKPYQNLGGHRY